MDFNKFQRGLFVLPIRFYQYIISPHLHKACRYNPSCSEYMIQAIEKYGPIKGIPMGIHRISRCHPFGGQGYDPLP